MMLVLFLVALLVGVAQSTENVDQDMVKSDQLTHLDDDQMQEADDSDWLYGGEALLKSNGFNITQDEQELEAEDSSWLKEEETQLKDNEFNATGTERQYATSCPCWNSRCHKMGGRCLRKNEGFGRCHLFSRSKYNRIFCSQRSCRCCINCNIAWFGSSCRKVGGRCSLKCSRKEFRDTCNCCPAYKCVCCRRCKRQHKCRKLGGYCLGPGRKCRRRFIKYNCGCIGRGCGCCVHRRKKNVVKILGCKRVG